MQAQSISFKAFAAEPPRLARRITIGLIGSVPAILLVPCFVRDLHVPVYPVVGRILINGRPPLGAQVTLHPEHQGRFYTLPSGRVDSEGMFRIATCGVRDGAPVGRYIVTLEWRLRPPAADGIPPRYARPTASPFLIDVGPQVNQLPLLSLNTCDTEANLLGPIRSITDQLAMQPIRSRRFGSTCH